METTFWQKLGYIFSPDKKNYSLDIIRKFINDNLTKIIVINTIEVVDNVNLTLTGIIGEYNEKIEFTITIIDLKLFIDELLKVECSNIISRPTWISLLLLNLIGENKNLILDNKHRANFVQIKELLDKFKN